jgi:hypothetical protein
VELSSPIAKPHFYAGHLNKNHRDDASIRAQNPHPPDKFIIQDDSLYIFFIVQSALLTLRVRVTA